MKIKTIVAVAMVSIASSFAFADQGDILITFSTPGPDKYADGATVEDGEWYALTWAPQGQTFGGLTTACQPVVAGQELILAAPLAKGGKCPFVAFEFARNDKYNNGKFSVLMLDTRNARGKPAARGANGLPVFVNGAAVASETTKGSAMSVDAATVAAVNQTSAQQAALSGDTVLTPATISSVEVLGANIQLTVSPFDPTANYVIKTGATADNLSTFTIQAPTAVSAGEKSAKFILPKEKGNFFSVGAVVPAAK